MDTSGLRGFAVWARVALIREVAGRVAAVLAPGAVQRVEQPVAVGALERAVAAAGGGEAGRAAVADTVAYTWFNRIIALRFMDANGYTGAGVVSPQAGVTVGQPEVLADAKRGVLDAEVVSTRTQQTVMALLDGTRPSPDPQGEAYGLLLAEYCRFWNQAMPFMFELEGDFTELLMPANLLADDSVLNRAVKVLTAEVCTDVEVIGWLYQFYISERKDEVFAGFKKNKKAGPAEIPAATQLFTPHWIVRYLVENSLGRLWMLNHPDSRLVDQMDYYIPPVDAETDFLKISSPEDIKIIDPACGSGHMLTYAFDLLYAIYQEEGYAPSQIPELILAHNLYGTEIDPRAGTLAAFALTMKATARRKLFLKYPVQPNICVIEPISFTDDELDYLLTPHGNRTEEEAFWNQFRHADLLGSLIQPDPQLAAELTRHLELLNRDGTDDLIMARALDRAQSVIEQANYLLCTYTTVVANPPYMGSKNMAGGLSTSLKTMFEGFHTDLFAAFVHRIRRLVVSKGLFGVMTPNVWLYISSHTAMRHMLTGNGSQLLSLVELPLAGFKAATVQICAFTASASSQATNSHFVRLVDVRGGDDSLSLALRTDTKVKSSSGRVHVVTPDIFASVPNRAIAYWLPDDILNAFSMGIPLDRIAKPRQGMATADNGRFLRRWFEVSWGRVGIGMSRHSAAESGRKWFPYNKGGEFRKWYGNQVWVVNWGSDGEELFAERPKAVIRSPQYYFQPSLSWSKVGTGLPAFRYFPEGFLFDVAGTSIFADAPRLNDLAAILNSSAARAMLTAISPTLNLEVGTIAQFPVVEVPEQCHGIVSELISLHKDDWDRQETSWDFKKSPLCASKHDRPIRDRVSQQQLSGLSLAAKARDLESYLNEAVADAYGLLGKINTDVPLTDVTMVSNPALRPPRSQDITAPSEQWDVSQVVDLVSYAVGCMFGRYSLDVPGLVLADQGATLQDYVTKVPEPRFLPDADNVLPVVDGDWFEDDIVARFRQFLRVAFGEQHFEENLRFVTESLGVKDMRDYFVKSFYKDHVQRYKKRPIYWMFSSPKGSFNALIYMHRYAPTTVSTVLNEYLREFQAKVTASLDNAQRSNNAKEADRLRKTLLELQEYEHDVLYPLATQQIHIDLDDGVKTNYPKLGKALKKVPGLETTQ